MNNLLKSVLIAGCGLALSLPAMAEGTWWDGSKSNEGYTLSGNIGLNISDFRGADEWHGAKAGINVGVMVEKPILNSLAVKAGLFYSMKGNRHTSESVFDSKLTVTYDPGYLEIPILATYNYDFNEALKFRFDFGPYFGIGVNGKDVKKVSGGKVQDSKTEYDLFGKDGQWRRFDFGFRFGPEVVWKEKFTFGLAYEVSAINIWPNSGGNLGNSTFMINLGYRFLTF